MAGLVLKDVRKIYGDVTALQNIDLVFPSGKLTALLGPSGCGKTTLLRIIAGLDTPTRGSLSLNGDDITTLPANKRKFGMVFQSFALFPHLSVGENVAYSLSISGVEKSTRLKRAQELLDLVQMADFQDRRIGQLSGGQRQRVAIARALAQEPEVFLLDEPMSALDAQLRETMQVELRLLQQQLNITTIVVTHDQREAMTMADEIVVMSNGRSEQIGSPTDIYQRPETPFVASFIGKANFIDGIVRGGRIFVGDDAFDLEKPASFVDGAPVQLVCRPENVELCSVDETSPNKLTGSVSFVRDVGPTREVFVETNAGRVICEMPSSAGAFVAQGENTGVRLRSNSLLCFPGQAPAAAGKQTLASASHQENVAA
ncbi:ABC transporter ATP-binding protein [uncultured Roseibium sp.]|uniref:ABC transporter ATP-binding protein n=1 Tax=uncultured Roseibium sp. TaxID=1936171 RepID=UPI002626F0B1|nr:ABC transporter ATP-binding protein [uncultured Roseibium sp.]